MNDRRRAAALSLAAVAALAIGVEGCKRKAPPEAASIAPPPPASDKPLDHLAPGELAAGTDSLYGLVLPKGMTVSAHFPRKAHATGTLAFEDVANYVRDRVDVQRIELGAVGTVFPSVHIKDGDPSVVLRIEVVAAGDRTELIFNDITPRPAPPPEPNLTTEEKWRRAGYKPDGTPLDPMHLH